MYKFVLNGIENIEIWPIISLVLFLTVFIIACVYAVTANKKYIQRMENLPFEGEEEIKSSIEN